MLITRLVLIISLQILSVTYGANIPSNRDALGTKIVDMNFDCLENVCRYLSDEDLLNVARANSHLTEVANYVSWHHGEKIVWISDNIELKYAESQNNHPSISDRINMTSSEFRSSLPTIFGGIKGIALDLRRINDSVGLVQDITKYCSKHLITIEFYGIDGALQMLNESFPNVENVVFADGTINANLVQLKDCFPAMKSLKILNVDIINPELLVHNFPNLVKFVTMIDEFSGISLPIFKRILLANPQIRNLNISEVGNNGIVRYRNSDLIQSIHEMLPELEELSWGKNVDLIINTSTPLIFHNVKKFDVYLSKRISIGFEKLESVAVTNVGNWWNGPIFFANQNELTTLKLTQDFRGFSSDIMNVLRSLPKLKEFYLEEIYLDTPILTGLLMEFKSLRKIQYLYQTTHPRYAELTAIVPNTTDWKYTFEFSEKFDFITFER